MNTATEIDDTSEESQKIRSLELDDPAFVAGLATPYIYVYYLRITGDPRSETEVYCIDRGTPVPANKIEAEIWDIAAEIGRGEHTPSGWRIGDVRWRRRSYMVFLLDDPRETVNGVTFTPGHAFRDGRTIGPFNTPAGRRITGYYCNNHMKKRDDSDVDATGERIRVHVGHTRRRESGRPVTLGHEDTATNMGPPIGSP